LYVVEVVLDQKIDACWDSKCKAECVDGVEDAGLKDAGPDAGVCKTEPDTGDVLCDQCTNMNCCAAWDGCFDTKACTDYEDCYDACP